MELNWWSKRKLRKILSRIRKIEIDEINAYMDKVYNPINVVSKPKYRSKETVENEELTRRYIHMIYDPPLKAHHKKDHTLDEYMDNKAKT